MESPRFHPREWVFVFLAGLAILLAASLPFLSGWLFPAGGAVYTGAAVAAPDYYSYLAKIRQGMNGSWNYQLAFSSQQHPGAPLFLYYLALGRAADWLGLAPPAAYHLARLVNSLLFFAALYAFIGLFSENPRERRYLFFFTALTSGLGWLSLLAGHLTTSDLSIPESNPFYSLLAAAHFPLSAAAVLIFFLLLALPPAGALRRWMTIWLLLALICALLMFLQPFLAAVYLSAGGIYLLAVWRLEGRFPGLIFWRLVVSTAVCASLAVWTWQTLSQDPFLINWQHQNWTPSPPVWDYLLGFGLPLLAAGFGLVWAWRQKQARWWLIFGWILAAAIGLYAPTLLQRRFSLGLHIPIALLGGMGVLRVWASGRSPRRASAVAAVFMILSALTSLLLVIIGWLGVRSGDERVYLSRDEAAALTWLENNAAPLEVASGSDSLNQFIPAFTDLRAVSGHAFETADYLKTAARLEDILSGRLSPTEMAAQLAEWRVSYLIIGPRETRPLAPRWAELPFLSPVFQSGTVTIYRITLNH